MSEFEFPPAVSTVVRQLAPGLLILLSLHDLGGIDAKVRDSAQATLNQVGDRLTQAIGVPGGICL